MKPALSKAQATGIMDKPNSAMAKAAQERTESAILYGLILICLVSLLTQVVVF